VPIGAAVLKKSSVKESMSFVLPMEVKGHKMGELKLKMNYKIGSGKEEEKTSHFENVAVQTPIKHHAGEQFYKAVSLPGITLSPETKILPSSRSHVPEQPQPFQLTQANQAQLMAGLRSMAETNSKKQELP